MNLPKPDSTETVIHNDIEQTVIVRKVVPELGTMWRVIVDPLEDVFKEGDTVFWIDGEKRHQTFVRDLRRDGDHVRFALVAGTGW